MEYILGIAASLIVQFIKSKYGTGTSSTLVAVFLVSLICAGGYVLLSGTSIWPSIVQVMITAGAFYAFIIQRFE